VELELEERAKVDNVISFFTDMSAGEKMLDDDNFYDIGSL